MSYLLALSILAASVLLSGCGRSYNSNSTAYRNRSYSTSLIPSHRRHREHGSRGSGDQGGSHHHHHGGDHDRNIQFVLCRQPQCAFDIAQQHVGPLYGLYILVERLGNGLFHQALTQADA
jgi:hypothetical protein